MRLPGVSDDDRAFGDACLRVTARVHPSIIDEFEGMREASGLPADAFTSYYFGRTAPLAGGCTNIAVTGRATRRAQVLVGRNYDWGYADRRWCEARLVAPAGEPRRIGYTHHWGGLCDVMSETGLTVCVASLPPRGATEPGVQWHVVVDMVATRCRTVAEAAELMGRVPHVRSIAYLVADEAAACLVEAVPGSVHVHESENGILVGTNHRLEAPPRPGALGHASVARRDRAVAILSHRHGRIDENDLRRVLSDHEAGICAGAHGPSADGGGTIWSMVAEPARRTFKIAPGHPCTRQFEAVRWSTG